LKILTTQPKSFHPAWLKTVTVLPGWAEYARKRGRKNRISLVPGDLRWAWRLFAASKTYSAVATGSEHSALAFAILQKVFRRRPVPHILLECMWNEPPRGPRAWLRRSYLKMIAGCVDRIVVWSSRQVSAYETILGGRDEKFVFVPYHNSFYGIEHRVFDGGYIFAGGDSNRDYGLLIEAVRHLPIRVVIASRNRALFQSLEIPSNVEILTATRGEFCQYVAGASIVVVPMRGGLLHSGGHQTYVNAMGCGKPVVVADDSGADEYIENGMDGFVVPPGDVRAMRECLARLVTDEELRGRIGRNAETAARRYTMERYTGEIAAIVEKVSNDRLPLETDVLAGRGSIA